MRWKNIHTAKYYPDTSEQPTRDCLSDILTYLIFSLLLLIDVKNLENFHLVESVQEQVNAALLDYVMCNYPQQTDKFGQLLLRLPEIRAISLQAEEYLYYKHLNGDVPCNNLLIEMLHAKRA